jgi:hypothetical protein
MAERHVPEIVSGRTPMKIRGATALLICLMTINQAFAGFFNFTPNPPAPPAVPEFDGPSAIAASALLVGVVAILYQKVRK